MRRSNLFKTITRLFLAALACLAPAIVAAQTPAQPSARDVAMVDAVTWGVNGSSIDSYMALGPQRWLQAQLRPSGELNLPVAAQKQIDALRVTHESPFDMATEIANLLSVAKEIADPAQRAAAQLAVQREMNDIARQAATRTILRALYSPDQLRERMTWFWFNHFNVHQNKANVRVLVADYEDRAIRANALGRFRDLLEATLRHPAMLRYLDNADNAAGRINENYAREIMELHTMGVGSGYTQKDVEELARILTGVGVDPRPVDPKLRPDLQLQLVRDGLFEFNPARHDYGDKVFLGRVIKGRGFAEVEQALDMLAAQPATARHVSRRIATYFVADDPPTALVERMADRFTKTQGDIAGVLETMFRSPEFAASLGTRFKDPMRYVVSAVRLAYDGKVILNTGPIQNWLNRLGEGLYGHQTPDGYPLSSSAWNGPGQMMARFEIARQIGSGAAGLFKPPEADAVATPAFPLLQNALYFSALGRMLRPPTATALDLAMSAQEWNTLFLSSPEFMNLRPLAEGGSHAPSSP
ncbi:DUF1800 domain-containing protein [Methylocystis sp. ATCC 49242]|uniref:DUF1800 domain-containing protein n=1 Tax=Methylocystis sp. ATCC 49242 TaxID=622637 RepID=UPI000302B267